MTVNDYYFVVNEKTQAIEGYSKYPKTIKNTFLKKKETKPNNVYTLRRATFGNPIDVNDLEV